MMLSFVIQITIIFDCVEKSLRRNRTAKEQYNIASEYETRFDKVSSLECREYFYNATAELIVPN